MALAKYAGTAVDPWAAYHAHHIFGALDDHQNGELDHVHAYSHSEIRQFGETNLSRLRETKLDLDESPVNACGRSALPYL